jgi:UDP-2,3-diacylglucosamine pyrophosphatase LpxH
MPKVVDQPIQPTLTNLTEIFTRRRDERNQLLPIPERVTHDFGVDHPVLIALIGDTHIGAENVDYERLHDEVSAVAQTQGAYALFMGDLVDGFFFMPGKDGAIGNLAEEALFAHAVFDELQGKVIAAWGGDHDVTWASKTGPTMYQRFREETGGHYLHGLSHVDMIVGEQTYKLTGAHRLPGFSMYNNTHGQMRARNFDAANGADIVVSGHTHRKGHARQPARSREGTQMVDYISIGAYKSTDEYARKLGFGRQEYDDMGGYALILHPNEHRVQVFDDIRQGIQDFEQL